MKLPALSTRFLIITFLAAHKSLNAGLAARRGATSKAAFLPYLEDYKMKQDNPKKFQVQSRMKKFIVPCDKLSSHPFDYPAEEYATIITNGEECECVEGTDKKGNEVVTPYWLRLVGEYLDTKPLTPFHREVLFAAISAYEQGYCVLTFKSTLNTLTGSIKKGNIYSEQYTAIKAAIDKLAFTRITVDLAPLLKAYPNYKRRYTGKAELISTLLPARYIEAEINGQKTLAVELLGESPLMTIAKMKKQVLTYDATPLAVPNQNHTENVMTIDNYLLRRVHLIKRGVNPSILLETVYRNCGLENATRKQKWDARKIIAETLNHFKTEGVIKNFEFERRDGSYHSIKITLQ